MNELVDKELAKSIARLKLANAHLDDMMKGRDWGKIRQARTMVTSSMHWFKVASANAEKTGHNNYASAIGVAAMVVGEALCNEYSQNVRLFFEVIQGGKTDVQKM